MGNSEEQCPPAVWFRGRRRTKTQNIKQRALDGSVHARVGSPVY